VASKRGEPTIIVHSGLIKALIFHMEFSEICFELHQKMGEGLLSREAETEDQASFSILAYTASSALDQFAGNGVALPRIGALLSAEAKNRVFMSFVRAIWFVVIHELGHIRCGHLNGDRAAALPSSPSLAVAETVSDMKSQEFEADRYVAATLEGRERELAVEYLISPLDLLSTLERRLRLAADTHPMALNRLAVMVEYVAPFVDASQSALARGTIADLVRGHRDRLTRGDRNVERGAVLYAIAAMREFYAKLAGTVTIQEPPVNHVWDDFATHWFPDENASRRSEGPEVA
jgi:hypothetical protein